MSNVLKVTAGKAKPIVKVLSGEESIQEEREAESIQKRIEDAYKKGFNDGQQKLRRDLEKEFSEKLYKKYEEVFNILSAYDQRMEEFETAFESLVINTAYEISKKILQREIEIATLINENLKAAISKIIGANEVKIRLNPDDLDKLNEYSKNLLNNSSFNKIKFEPDNRIEKGGCLVETEIGNVDARISSQLDELRKKLEESIPKKEK
ncbi:MAG: FliH/SctL family protein [Melioribacter sp.]|uniref:FliH/SctL family protein n=1 Tax=Rosettibacter primus TaxID=3111523 RepID=UPI00247CD26F|nr:FliH/SctL family protein [Melioribacter sp.]